VRVGNRAFEFRVELHTDKPWMPFQFNYFDKIILFIDTRGLKPCFPVPFKVPVIEFIPVTVTFQDIFRFVNPENL